MVGFRTRLLPVLVLLLGVACQTGSPGPTNPTPTTPTLTLTPASVNVNAGSAPITFTATVQNSTETVTWIYSGAGSITPTSGAATSYTPPASVESVQSGSLTAILGTSGVQAVAAIAIYPAAVTPPTEPPPVTPPTEPTPPTTPDMAVTIADVAPVTMGAGGTASASLSASTSNAPSGTTYKWTAQGNNPGTVSFASDTTEDTTATFSAAGSYTLRLTAKNGSESASDTVGVTVNPPAQTAEGVWDASFNAGGTPYAMSFDLEQAGENVTGTWTFMGSASPATGTFDGTKLTLKSSASGTEVNFVATVTANTMTGTISTAVESYAFTATRQPEP